MGCGCGGEQQQDLWRPVYADRTMGEPMSKAKATQEAARTGGYIVEANQPDKVKAA